MRGRDTIEFYVVGKKGHIAVAESSHAPQKGDHVCILGETYVVAGRSYTVDHAREWDQTAVVCVLMIEPFAALMSETKG